MKAKSKEKIHKYRVYIYRRFNCQWLDSIDVDTKTDKQAIKLAVKQYCEKNNIRGLSKLFYYGKASFWARYYKTATNNDIIDFA